MTIKILGIYSNHLINKKKKKDGSPRKSVATGRFHLNMNEGCRSESKFHVINLQNEKTLAQKKEFQEKEAFTILARCALKQDEPQKRDTNKMYF